MNRKTGQFTSYKTGQFYLLLTIKSCRGIGKGPESKALPLFSTAFRRSLR
jgi:hypothetical protein